MRAKEIDIIRTFVIIAVILFHSFAPYTGGWTALSDGSSIIDSIYKWLGRFTYAGMLETFTAISGYIFCLTESKSKSDIKVLLKKKVRRLFIPALIWGTVYYILFTKKPNISGINQIINGIGHLWYLPMLFCCFLIEKCVVLRFKIPLWCLVVLAVIPWPFPLLHFGTSLYYLLFFHMGFLLYQHRDIFALITHKVVYKMILLIAILVPISWLWRDRIDLTSMPAEIKLLYLSVIRILQLCYAIPIVFLYFKLGLNLRNTRHYSLFLNISSLSFGVYILQEFILRIVYYKIGIPMSLQIVSPIVGFTLALTICFAMAWVLRRCKIDKYLF